MAEHPDIIYRKTILSIILQARILWTKVKLTADLDNQTAAGRLAGVSKVGDHFIHSPLSLAPKFNGKWRRIYHLSYPRGRSVNCHIPKEWGALEYTTFDEATTRQRLFIRAEHFPDASNYDGLAKSEKYVHLSKPIEMIYCGGNNPYALTTNVTHYTPMCLAFVVQEDTSYLGTELYRSFARTYLPITCTPSE